MTDKKSELSRRAFLYTSLGGIASAGALTLGPRAIMAQEESEAKSYKYLGTEMPTREQLEDMRRER